MRLAVLPADELAPGEHRVVRVGTRSIGVFRVGDDYYALADHCPHQGGPLCRGSVAGAPVATGPSDVRLDEGHVLVACPWHGWEYDVRTGHSYQPGDAPARSLPASVEPGPPGMTPGPYTAETFEVTVEDRWVVVDTGRRPTIEEAS
ncbi:Rieske (2Fe-2S) protein [Pseudonocardia sp. ICBG1122]|nr:Rieske (2Fe-2S) protein [Pseudonocardia pini]